uniref:Transmembrane protein n=1 Tax=Daphnia galeata TaxID=27404 RepID=A0A8J2RDC9_9CRUS|nr:unnamed protein product [Daphnia galeata]
MALRKTKISELPPSAVRLTRQEAIEYQNEAIEQWKPQYQMWPLKYGSFALGTVSSASAVIINEYFRRALFLPKSSLFFIGMPIITVSSLTLTIIHHQLTTSNLLLMNTPCMPCMQGQTALLLGFFGTVYPVLACSFGNMMQAQKLDTTYIPPLIKERKQFLQMCQKMIQKKSNLFTKSLVINVILAVMFTHYQQKAFFRFNQQDQ